MRKKRFLEYQVIQGIKQVEGGRNAKDVCRLDMKKFKIAANGRALAGIRVTLAFDQGKSQRLRSYTVKKIHILVQ